MFIVSKLRGGLKVAAVKPLGFGDDRKETLKDLPVITGSEVLSDELGDKLEDVQITQLGTVKTVTITKNDTAMLDGAGEKAKIDERCEAIRDATDAAGSGYEKDKTMERLAKLSGRQRQRGRGHRGSTTRRCDGCTRAWRRTPSGSTWPTSAPRRRSRGAVPGRGAERPAGARGQLRRQGGVAVGWLAATGHGGSLGQARRPPDSLSEPGRRCGAHGSWRDKGASTTACAQGPAR